eukprot:5698105-Lingulodinium_polyedra.AAC.1
MRGAAAIECVSKRISEQLSRESCSEMRSEPHSTAATPHIFAQRALHANTIFGVCMERALCENARRRSGRMRFRTHF